MALIERFMAQVALQFTTTSINPLPQYLSLFGLGMSLYTLFTMLNIFSRLVLAFSSHKKQMRQNQDKHWAGNKEITWPTYNKVLHADYDDFCVAILDKQKTGHS